jgi:uncharacterized protein (TIRG00374 family)
MSSSPVKPWMRALLRPAIGGLILVVVVHFLARGVAWSDVLASLHDVRLPALLAVVALNALMMGVKAIRLRLLLAVPGATWRTCFTTLLAASAINNVLPLRGGDVGRLWILGRRAGVSKFSALGVAGVEALLEILALSLIALPASLLARGQSWGAPVSAVVAGTSVALLAILGRLAETQGAEPPAAARPTGRVARWAARVRAFRSSLGPGLGSLRKPRVVTRALCLSLVSWACETAMVVFCSRAMGLSVGPALAVVVLLGINLAIALPSLPASAGPFEGATVIVLVLSGFAKPQAVTFALLYHAVQVVPVTIAGLLLATHAGLSREILLKPSAGELSIKVASDG